MRRLAITLITVNAKKIFLYATTNPGEQVISSVVRRMNASLDDPGFWADLTSTALEVAR